MSTETWDRVLGRLDGGTGVLRAWVAGLVNDPAARRPYLFLYSPEVNTGRSLFHEAVALLIPGRVVHADFALRAGVFNGVLAVPGALCVVEGSLAPAAETPASARRRARYGPGSDRFKAEGIRRACERLKGWVTAPEIVIHEKMKAPRSVRNTTSWVQCGQGLDDMPGCLPGGHGFLTLRVPPLAAGTEIPKPQLLDALKAEAPAFLESLAS
jgi:hypothetical protein